MLDPPSHKLLEALAHPVRMEIYDTLQVARRPMTEREVQASTLGGRRGIHSQLRILQRAGLARLTDSRWEPLSPPVVVPAPDDLQGEDRALVERIHALWQSRRRARLGNWNRVNVLPRWAHWRRHVVALDYNLHLTPQELHELELRVMAAVREYRQEVAGADDPDREAVWMTVYAGPLDALR